REPTEVDGHAPRSHLIVGHLVPGVCEDELGELDRVVLRAVSLLLDQLPPSHVACGQTPFVATKTDEARRLRSGSSYGGSSGMTSGWSETTKPCTVSWS